jgi:hypothetical protein
LGVVSEAGDNSSTFHQINPHLFICMIGPQYAKVSRDVCAIKIGCGD